MSGRPIRAFVGLNGGGKTLAMVEQVALPALASGRKVYSTCRIGAPEEHAWIEGAEPLTELGQLMEVRDCAVLLDEVTSSFPARQAMSLPPDAQRLSQQLRKRDVDLAWTAPTWQRADKMFREVTQEVTYCKSMWTAKFVRDSRTGKVVRYDSRGRYSSRMFPECRGKPGARVRWPNAWPARELFRLKTYSAEDFEEYSLQTKKQIRAIRKDWYWRRWHQGWKSYSTLEEVELLAHLDEAGICVACGGTRARAKCKCVSKRTVESESEVDALVLPMQERTAAEVALAAAAAVPPGAVQTAYLRLVNEHAADLDGDGEMLGWS